MEPIYSLAFSYLFTNIVQNVIVGIYDQVMLECISFPNVVMRCIWMLFKQKNYSFHVCNVWTNKMLNWLAWCMDFFKNFCFTCRSDGAYIFNHLLFPLNT